MPNTKPARLRPAEPATAREPDVVDRMFDFIAELLPELPAFAGAAFDTRILTLEALCALKADVRAEFGGENVYIPRLSPTARQQRAADVLRLFNGRNATEVARRLQISRATVYRMVKQPGRAI